MLPLRDENPTRATPVLTLLVIAVNLAVFFLVQPSDTATRQGQLEQLRFNFEHAAIPCEVVEGEPLSRDELVRQSCEAEGGPVLFPDKNVWLAVAVSMFLHGGLFHLLGNMWFLWIFGNNIEDHLGRVRYAIFYAAAGFVAAFAHVAVDPGSTIPVVGASGAIAGVMGAYLVWFPMARVLTFLGFFLLPVPAALWLGIWFVGQFRLAGAGSGVAWMAHVGGFVFGVLVALAVRLNRRAQHALFRPEYADEPWHGGQYHHRRAPGGRPTPRFGGREWRDW